MSLEQFGFVKSARSAAISSAVDSEDQTEDACKSDDPTAPPSKRGSFNSSWTEGCTWLKHDQDNSVMFCEWCRRFDRNEHRNQFGNGEKLVQGAIDLLANHMDQDSEPSQRQKLTVLILKVT